MDWKRMWERTVEAVWKFRHAGGLMTLVGILTVSGILIGKAMNG